MFIYTNKYKIEPPKSIYCCLYVYGFSADHLVLNNQIGKSSLGKPNFLFVISINYL